MSVYNIQSDSSKVSFNNAFIHNYWFFELNVTIYEPSYTKYKLIYFKWKLPDYVVNPQADNCLKNII